jgi:hypothetical protein
MTKANPVVSDTKLADLLPLAAHNGEQSSLPQQPLRLAGKVREGQQ